jgi:hypothetical protein
MIPADRQLPEDSAQRIVRPVKERLNRGRAWRDRSNAQACTASSGLEARLQQWDPPGHGGSE